MILIALQSFSTLTAQTIEPTVEVLLDQIEAKADTIKTYQAAVRFEQIQGLLGDTQLRFGNLYYVSKPKVKFAVDFNSIVIDGQRREQKRKWVYDGIWLVEQLDEKKQFFKRQVHAPPTPGQADPHDDHMSMENSPFPIPLQAKKAEILKRFDVKLVTEKMPTLDPKQVTFYHLALTPKPSAKISFTQIDLWYDKATLLPIKCQTVNDDSDDEQIFSLFSAKLNEAIAPDILSTSAPTQSGWHVEVTPLKQHPQ
tara:strand:- start:21 stop:782 length:762 start_codon:yes stop_codon:yes gene_type:complete